MHKSKLSRGFAVTILMACATQAFATNNGNDKGNTYNQPGAHATGGQGGSASAGAAALAGAVATGGNSSATGGDSKASVGDVTGGSVLGSGNSSIKDSGNSTAGAAVVGSGNSGSKSEVKGSGNADVQTDIRIAGDTIHAPDIPVNTAYAPNVMPTAVCALSASGGLTVANFSLSGGGTWIDDNCVLLEQVRRANEIGQREVASEMMMEIPAFAKAAKRVADRKAAQAAAQPVVVAPVAEIRPTAAPSRFSEAEVSYAKRNLGLAAIK